MKTKLAPWLIFAALLCLWLVLTGIDNSVKHVPYEYHKPQGEPVCVAEVMRPARWEDAK